MRPDSLIALTYLIRMSVMEDDMAEANMLLAQRSSAIQEMVQTDQRLSVDEREAIRRADDMLLETLSQRKSATLTKLQQSRVRSKVSRTYRGF